MNNDSGTATYEYDDFGRMVKETDVTGAVKEYTYDENGNRTSFKLTIDGTQQMHATYTYDKLNQLTGVTIGGDTTEYGYDKNGNILNKTTGQLITEYAYNQGNMLTQMATTHPNQSYPVNKYIAFYFMDGNLKEKQEDSEWATYSYDGLNRLVSDNGTEPLEFTYDAYGNIKQKSRHIMGPQYEITDYTYNANNQLVQSSMEYLDYTNESDNTITTTQYVYDENGNLISETPQKVSKGGGSESVSIDLLGELSTYEFQVKQYSYNGFDQQIGAAANDKIATYTYNPDGLRVSKTVNGETTTHILDGSNVVADVTNGSISKYNRGRGLISIEQDGNKGYYMFDGHGNVTEIVSGIGENVNSYWFTAFGMGSVDHSSFGFRNPFGYTGEYTDPETEHIYLRARYYDPNTGRFTSEDPVQSGTNWYAYCGNNPVMFIDPSGLYAYLSGDQQYWGKTFDEMQRLTDDTLDYDRETGQVYILEKGTGDKISGTDLMRDLLEDTDYTVYVERNRKTKDGNAYGTGEITAKKNFSIYNINDEEISDPNSFVMLQDEDGNTYLQSYDQIESFLFLGHELVHAQHRKNGTYNNFKQGINYFMFQGEFRQEQLTGFYNEEYETVGIQYFTVLDNPNSKSINPRCQISTYQPITENTIRQENGMDDRVVYSTLDRYGNIIN